MQNRKDLTRQFVALTQKRVTLQRRLTFNPSEQERARLQLVLADIEEQLGRVSDKLRSREDVVRELKRKPTKKTDFNIVAYVETFDFATPDELKRIYIAIVNAFAWAKKHL